MSDVQTEITLTVIEPGGENEPGIYWTFGDSAPDSKWSGPFETEEMAIESAKEALAELFAESINQTFGEML